MSRGYIHVLAPTSRKGNLQTRIFHSIFPFEKLGKKSQMCVFVKVARIMHRTKEEPQTEQGRGMKK